VTNDLNLTDREIDRLLAGRTVDGADPALADLIASLAALVPECAPAPNAALAALFDGGLPVLAPESARAPQPPVAAGDRRTRRPVVVRVLGRASMAGALGLTALVGAGLSGALPAAQGPAATVVGWVTPFDLPRGTGEAEPAADELREAPSTQPDSAPPAATDVRPTAAPHAPGDTAQEPHIVEGDRTDVPGEEPTDTTTDPTDPATDSEEGTATDTDGGTDEGTDEGAETPTDEPTDEPADEPSPGGYVTPGDGSDFAG
jgi:hypothetical protein